jgi:serine/threonine-protein kinase
MSAERHAVDRLLGQTLAERYQILHRLGEGAMGVVYKARHVKVGRLFAVKVLHPRTLQDSKVAQRFAREAELAGRLRHPNVIGVVDVGEVDGTRYMVMEFAEGPDLAKLLDEAPMPPERIIKLVRQMLDGLHHAHEQGLIHRDFKPENVIVERDSQGSELPRIVDFGIALLREGSDAPDGMGRLTTNGLVLGTPHYMAPEQAVADPIDHRIDLFALGIVIYEMLSGRLPFDGGGAEVARANLLLDPPAIRDRVPRLEVDPLLEAFSRRLMAKRRDARPATAKAARELLDLIDRDRQAAAIQLGVPVARSGRAPAVTEQVPPDEQPITMQGGPETARMRPTPRSSEPALAARAPSPDAAQVPAVVVEPAFFEAGAAPSAPAQIAAPLSPGQAAPVAPGYPPPYVYGPTGYSPQGYGPPQGVGQHRYGAHRDTSLRTPLGWQTSSFPNRRRSWLIGGAAVGTAGLITAAILLLSGADDEPAADRAAVPTSRDTTARESGARTPGTATPDTPAAATGLVDRTAAPPPADPTAPAPTAPAPAAPDGKAPSDVSAAGPTDAPDPRAAGTPVRSRDDDHRRAPARPGRKPSGTSTTPSRTAGDAAAGTSATAVASSSGPVTDPTAASPREPTAREPAVREPDIREPAKPAARPEAPRSAPAKPPTGVSPTALHTLFDTVWRELGQLPADKKSDLTGQMLVFKINDAMFGTAADRDVAAAQLTRILEEVRRRKAAP